ncbi:MAG: CopG family transcriptional regulator [Phenylobacterium sp.]|nr:CopG family transcriptional regulator [Phenylobacterium sp.]
MEEEPSVFDIADDEADELAALEGEAQLDAGRYVSHEAVVHWLRSWGTPDKLPPPKCGE